MDFKSFKKNASQRNDNAKKDLSQDDLRKTAEDYAKKSDSDLLSDIFKMAKEQKANGSLSDEKLSAFAQSVSPMLNDEQRKRMQDLLSMLKDN